MIHINKFIFETLSTIPALTDIIQDRLYILNIPEKDINDKDVNNPVVWYARAIRASHNKQGAMYECVIKIFVHTDTYYQGCDIAEIIIDALNGKSSDEYGINNIYFESLQDNDFKDINIQEITFKAI